MDIDKTQTANAVLGPTVGTDRGVSVRSYSRSDEKKMLNRILKQA